MKLPAIEPRVLKVKKLIVLETLNVIGCNSVYPEGIFGAVGGHSISFAFTIMLPASPQAYSLKPAAA